MPISNIDELLMGGSTSQNPMPIEEKMQTEPEPIEEIEQEDYDESDTGDDYENNVESDEEDHSEDNQDISDLSEEQEIDEYGNEKERMPKGMKERLDRKDKQYQREIEQRELEINQLRAQLAQQGASSQVQKAAQDFEYDPEASGDWQQQLALFVKQTVNSMQRETQESQAKAQEQQAQQQFESKFRDGMSKFSDFREVITSLPCEISNPMTLATRAMDNPAAFLYAAAKRHPQELERISKIRDPYGQMMEMGKLEERMRKSRPVTKTPRPLGKVREDALSKEKPKQKALTGDDLLASADAKRLNSVRTRLKNNR